MTTLKMVKLGFKRLCSCFKGPAGRWQQDLDQVSDTSQSLALSTLKHCFLLHTPHILSHTEAPCCCHTARTPPIQGWYGAPEGRNSTPAASHQKVPQDNLPVASHSPTLNELLEGVSYRQDASQRADPQLKGRLGKSELLVSSWEEQDL